MLLQLIKMFDETAFSLRLDLAREKKLTEEAEERHEKEVADEIIRIADRCVPPARHSFPPNTVSITARLLICCSPVLIRRGAKG